MPMIERFDPFNNRLCRDVRNALSESFKRVLDQKEMQPAGRIAGFFRNDSSPACIKDYIDRRLAAYARVLAHVLSHRLEHPLDIAVAIWDRQLFFETHEYLEPHWIAAAGDKKRLLQALIQAAGTYVHLEQGNLAGARSISAKAIDGLQRCSDQLAPYADPRLLVRKLSRLDPDPPLLGGTGRPRPHAP